MVASLVNCSSGPFVFMAGCGDDGVDPCGQSAGVISCLEMGLYFVLSNLFANGVRQSPFKAIAHLYKHLVVLNKNEENDTVVRCLLPHLPRSRDTNGIIVD